MKLLLIAVLLLVPTIAGSAGSPPLFGIPPCDGAPLYTITLPNGNQVRTLGHQVNHATKKIEFTYVNPDHIFCSGF